MGKEFHLNTLVNRYGFNRKKRIGSVIELISIAMPFEINEWEEFYYINGKKKQEIDLLGEEMYKKLIDVFIPEILTITASDCKDYLKNLIINKTFDGIKNRFLILRGELLEKTNKTFEFLPDHPTDWRYKTHKIDYYYKDEKKDLLIGIKVCPHTMNKSTNPLVIEALNDIKRVHKEWQDKDAGYFFILFYSGSGNNLRIQNNEILGEIKNL